MVTQKLCRNSEKNLNNSVPIADRYNAEYAVKSSSSLVIVCAQIKMSTYGNSKTVCGKGDAFGYLTGKDCR